MSQLLLRAVIENSSTTRVALRTTSSPIADAARPVAHPTVLVGFAEADAAPEVVWSLVDAGLRVVAFARRRRQSALRHSRHVECHEIAAPEVDAKATLADFEALLRTVAPAGDHTPAVLLPIDDTAVWLCRQARLGSEWVSAGPFGDDAALALDKNLQIDIARESGFNVPDTLFVQSASVARGFARRHGFPLVLKPADCVVIRGGRRHSARTWVCANQGELERALAVWGEHPPLIAQKFISGTGEGVFGIAMPEGVRAWSAHRRLRMMNPHGSGSSACMSQPVPTDVRSQVSTFVARAGWRGMFMIELLRDAAGRAWFVELNGRAWGSMALSRRQGLEYPAWHVALAMDRTSTAGMETTAMPGLACRHLGRELLHLLFVLRGPQSTAYTDWPSFWRSLADVSTLGLKDGVYNWRRSDPKVFVADLCYTLRKNLFK